MAADVRFKSYKDINLSFKRHPVTNDIFSINGRDAVKRSVLNLIRTKVGERFFASILGTDVESSLFDLDTFSIESKVNSQIRNVLENFEPRVVVKDVYTKVQNHDLDIKITYDIVGIESEIQEIDLLIGSGR